MFVIAFNIKFKLIVVSGPNDGLSFSRCAILIFVRRLFTNLLQQLRKRDFENLFKMPASLCTVWANLHVLFFSKFVFGFGSTQWNNQFGLTIDNQDP